MSEQHPKDAEYRERLTREQYDVARKGGTEPAFTGIYHDHKGDGHYHCVCCSAPLFDSGTKFDSGTGWPSFTEPAEGDGIRYIEDRSFGMKRVEVRCQACDAHLGHVFPDGPTDGGQRYCINSASLDFQERQAG